MCVTYLLDSIECNNAPLQAAMALVRNDHDSPLAKANNFEATASFLLKCHAATKQTHAQASFTDDASDFTPKSGKGKTGVELQYYMEK